MNRRLQQFLSAENISQSQFADTIGVARASVSHILAGRNKPGFDFIENMSRNYPTLNLEWLITGKGRMYKADSSSNGTGTGPIMTGGDLFADYDAPLQAEKTEPVAVLQPDPIASRAESNESKTSIKTSKSSAAQRSVSKIVIFYDDNTYQELK